jgi:uncharacterized Fe-S radical SAM superfamily protein PflX
MMFSQERKHTGDQYKHEQRILVSVMKAIKPEFKALAYPYVMKCVHVATQNLNEIFNNLDCGEEW